MSCDFIALLLQATGGAIADTAPTEKGSMAGTHIMVAGLAFQVLSLLVFIALAIEFMFKVQKSNRAGASGSSTPNRDDGKAARFQAHGFKHFIAGMYLYSSVR
jgi:Na+-transporting methylmalonyl-CoA/oxaloacetate decarboxylase gamma subunit